jgi:protein disulfide-isomerase
MSPGLLCTYSAQGLKTAGACRLALAAEGKSTQAHPVKISRVLLSLGAIGLLGLSSASAKPGWLTDLKQAQADARSNKKLLLLDFTGSDWCGWCIRLDKEVFSKPEFKEYASKNLVLMEIDFPKGRQLASAERMQNQELAERYGIQGFPTIVVLDSEGKKVGELGYTPGGPSAFIAELESLRKG